MSLQRALSGVMLAVILAGCSAPLPIIEAPTATPSANLTPSQTPTPTATPTPTPTPTPLPAAQLASADHALWYGDYDLALEEYKTALEAGADEEIAGNALFGIGRIHYVKGDYPAALESLRRIEAEYPDSSANPMGFFLLGQVYQGLKRYDDAAAAFDRYLTLSPGKIDSYAQELRGDALYAAGQYDGAVEAYQTAKEASHLGDDSSLDIKVGQVYLDAGNYQAAIETFTSIYTETSNDYTRADADLLSGRAYLAIDDLASANDRFIDAVVNFPRAYSSYAALVYLIQNGVPVNDFYRGLVDYYAGQYQPALAALDRYLWTTPDHDGTALHYKALTLIALEDYNGAILAWDSLIEGYPENRYWATAWDEKAFILWADLHLYEQAAQTLLDFVARAPSSEQAPDSLYEAARIYERADLLEEAANTWERLIDEYPASAKAIRGLFFAGISRYRLGDLPGAKVAFQRSLLLAEAPEDQAAAALWVGKIQQADGDPQAAQVSWRQAADYDPTGYYSERALELLLPREPFSPPVTIDLGMDLPAEKAAAAAWLKTTFALPAELDLNSLGSLTSDSRMVRGETFWKLGLFDKARSEFEDLRQELDSDPANLFRLVSYLYDLGLFRSAILGSRQILTLAHMDDAGTLKAPAYFNHLRFGPYYRDLVLPAAQEEDLDPLLIFSLMRQESMFEGFIQSDVGARGLMQIMPATGDGIAANMGWPPGYTSDDLYRPVVSVRLGAHYLAQQLDYLDGSLYAALAAYNGGPGNALAWFDLAGSDPDLFLEVVRIQQTRDYIMRIFEIYAFYRQFYDRTP